MAGLTRLELAASSVTGWRYNQLNYNPANHAHKRLDASSFRKVLGFHVGLDFVRRNIMAGLTRLELAASSVTGWRYNQLNYNPAQAVGCWNPYSLIMVGATRLELVTHGL